MALAAVSCSFLDVDPETQMTDEGFYESPNDIRSVLYSTYASLRDNGLYNTSIWTVADVRSDVAFPSATRYSANMYKHESEEFNITSNNTATQNFWSHSYRAIKRANTVIIKGQELFPDDADVQLYIVEAKVLRALFYFNLVRVFGDVPIVLDIPDSYSDAGDDVRMSVELVYEQILKDLTDAVNSGLMQGKNATPTGRVNLYAAEALLGKVFLNIPDEMALITFDRYPYSTVLDPLPTFVQIDVHDLGRTAGAMMLRVLKRPELLVQTYATLPRLVCNATTPYRP